MLSKKIIYIHVFVLLLATLSLFFGIFMPERRVLIFPIEGNPITLYSDEGWGGQTSVTWINKEKKHWQCHLAQSEFSPVCGLAVELSNNKTPFDFSDFTELSVKLKYTGEASKLRLYARNHNPAYSNPEDPDSYKFNSVNIPASDFNTNETIIKLSEFSVENWWIEERKIPRNLVHPELNNIITIGIDYPYPQKLGEHSIEMDTVELIGPLIPKTTYYFFLNIACLVLLAIEALAIGFYLNKNSNLKQGKPGITPKKASSPHTSSLKNGKLGHSPDVLSKNELTLKIKSVFNENSSRKDVSLILFKLDNFQKIIQKHSKTTAENIVSALHQLVATELQESDNFSRWSEEEFLILSFNKDKMKALELVEKLKQRVSSHTFEGNSTLEVSLSIGGTSVIQSDDFGAAFMRAEQALYHASSKSINHIAWVD